MHRLQAYVQKIQSTIPETGTPTSESRSRIATDQAGAGKKGDVEMNSIAEIG